MANLHSKRRKALWILTVGAGGTGFSSAIPTPTLEAPKQAAIALADIGLMAGIYTVYFDEDVGVYTIKDMLIKAGLIVSAGGGMAYGTIKATEAVMAEVLELDSSHRMGHIRHHHGLGHALGGRSLVVGVRHRLPERQVPGGGPQTGNRLARRPS